MNPVDRSIFAVGTYSKDIGKFFFQIIFTVIGIVYLTKYFA